METITLRRHQFVNSLQSLLLLAAMALLLGVLGWLVAGSAGLIWALIGGVVLVLFNPGFSANLILRLYQAQSLSVHQAPQLHTALAILAENADLPAVPALYYVPSRMINAFAVGTRRSAAIAVTDGLLRRLAPRELAGVLAHEISHIRHNDMWVMGLADLFSRMTGVFSILGQILILISLPLLLWSHYTINWLAILVLLLAPTLSALLQLALSRTREYDADLGAALLTGDPEGLALAKMERYQGRFFEQILLPGHHVPDPSLLRSHPPTEERIRRLLELRQAERALPSLRPTPPTMMPVIERRPRWYLHGIWY